MLNDQCKKCRIGWGSSFFTLLASIYPGYSVSYLGAVIGAVYGFVDAFICLWLLVWLYNQLGGDSA